MNLLTYRNQGLNPLHFKEKICLSYLSLNQQTHTREITISLINTLSTMKKISLTLAALSLITISIFTTSCNLFDDAICKSVEGAVESQTLDLDAFTAVDVRDEAMVYVTQGATQEIRVDAEQEILDNLEISVENDELVVRTKGCFRGDYTFDVFITLPASQALTDIEVSGAGGLFAQTPLEVADEVAFGVSGSGELEFQANNEPTKVTVGSSGSGNSNITVTTTDTDVSISGSGRVTLSGASQDLEAGISGSGSLKAYDFIAKNGNISVSGSGGAEVQIVGGTLDVTISGSGTVRYKGTPGEITESITGSGRLIDEN